MKKGDRLTPYSEGLNGVVSFTVNGQHFGLFTANVYLLPSRLAVLTVRQALPMASNISVLRINEEYRLFTATKTRKFIKLKTS